MSDWEPSYLRLLESGRLERRVQSLEDLLHFCSVCPRLCGVNRPGGEHGWCHAGRLPVVSTAFPHHGEEAILSGTRGSGTVFLSLCNMACVFCQNHDISQGGDRARVREECSHESLAARLLDLQGMGCHNINFVSPSHLVPMIARAILIAARQGLRLPIVYNTNAYDRVETLELLEGIVDIWLPDLKYAGDREAVRYSHGPHYPEVARAAIREMYRQVGAELVLAPDGTLRRGLLVRHLVMPGGVAGTADTCRWIARELDRDVAVNIMAQYHPAHHAMDHPAIARRLADGEYREALAAARQAGLRRIIDQG